jgi:hypothetical protein
MVPKKMGRVPCDISRCFFDCTIRCPDLGSSRHNDPKADSHRGHATTSSSAISTCYDND